MKRFAAGNIITFGDIGSLPLNITKGIAYKVEFIHQMYATGIRNDIGDMIYNFSGFVDVEEWVYKNKNIHRGTEVVLDSSGELYNVLGFEIEDGKSNGRIVLDIKKSR